MLEKIAWILVILLVTLVFGFAPKLFAKFSAVHSKKTKILGIANALSGGIFLGIAFFHLLPEAGEAYKAYFLENPSKYSNFPFSFFFAFISYSLILFIEKVAFNSHTLIDHEHEHEHDHETDKSIGEKEDEYEQMKPILVKAEDIKVDNKEPLIKTEPAKKKKSDHDHKDHKHKYTGDSTEKCLEKVYQYESQFKNDGVEIHEDGCSDEEEELVKNIVGNKGNYMAFMQVRNIQAAISEKRKIHKATGLSNEEKNIIADKPLLIAGQLLTRSYKEDIYRGDCAEVVNKCSFNEVEKIEHDHEHEFNPKSNLTPYILMCALSIHGLFEGIALGIQTEPKMIFFLGIAILSHKWAESFTLGISFYKTNTSYETYIKLIVMFSLFTPLGIIIGMFASGTSLILEAIFLSLASGSFIYISASEVIVEEFSVSRHKYLKFLFYFVGAILVCLLTLIEN